MLVPPDNNPKSVIGIKKIPLQLVPPSAVHHLAHAFSDGAIKYGPYNWREKSVAASVYIAAMKRHIDAWWDGEDLSEDAKVEHLAHAMACAAIILDASSIGKLVDDRPAKGAASRLQKQYAQKTENLVTVKELLQQSTEIEDSRLVQNYGRPVLFHLPAHESKTPFLDRFRRG